MTLSQTLKKIRETVAETGTDEQKMKLQCMSIGQLDSMVHIGQSMGVDSAISCFL